MSNVMIVDDEANVANSVRRLLETHDFSVIIAENNDSALRELRRMQDISVVISDQRIPELSTTEMHCYESDKQLIPVQIVLTGYTDVETILSMVNQGPIFRWLFKPWDDDELLNCITAGDNHYQALKKSKLLCQELTNKNKSLMHALEHEKKIINMNLMSAERYEKIFETLPIGILCIGDDGVIGLVNQQFMSDFKITSSIEGMVSSEVLPEGIKEVIGKFKDCLSLTESLFGIKYMIMFREIIFRAGSPGKIFLFKGLDDENEYDFFGRNGHD